jgi:tetratricopeptide (TPR) repeat protein
MPNRAKALRFVAIAALLMPMTAVFFVPSIAADEQDEKYTNLKVLPKDISKQDLESTMHSFTTALGVRCSYCHVRGNGPRADLDWANDSKPEKTTARVMLQMVNGINQNYLPQITTKDPDKVTVTCRTCHHGAVRPIAIEDILATSYQRGGLDSLSTRYEALRKSYYGTDTYNFGEWMIPMLAQKIAGQKDPEGMLKLAKFNLKWFPDSGVAHMMMGQALGYSGNTDEATAELNKAIQLDPDLRDNVERMLARLHAPQK